MGTYLFRWPYPADHVYVTGTFDDWGKSEKLEKVGDHWEKEVRLPSADHKIMYKFVVNDEWIVDENAPKEDDGHYNVNNVLQPEQIKPLGHRVIATSRGRPGSLSANSPTKAATVSAGGEGAPLLTLEQSEANMNRWIPHVPADPRRPVTRSLPQADGAALSKEEVHDHDTNVPGAFPATPANEPDTYKVDPLPATGHDNLESSATTSKEDYEKLGALGTAGVAGAGALGLAGLGATHADKKPDDVSVQPLPATGHGDTQSSVTTSKDDYEKAGGEGTASDEYGVKPIPATGFKDTQSSVTTSKEEYEKLGALGVAGAAVAAAGAAVASAFSKPTADDKNIIPESSLPMNPAKTDTLDAGPFINSSGPGTTTADLASQVPLEPRREAQVVGGPEAPAPSKEASATPFITSSGPGTTTADLASQVPLESDKGTGSAAPFISSVGAGATTAALASEVPLEKDISPEVKQEKSAMEKELLSKVPESEAKGAPASAAVGQTSYYGLATAVPQEVEQSLQKAHASPEAATESSVVAEKSLMEQELQSKVPVVDTAGEPAPTISAATTSTAPATTAAVTGVDLTDGKTANETVPGTDTSTATTARSAGEIAGGAVVGGAAAAGAAALVARHENKEAEPARVSDSTKPTVTTGVAPTAEAQTKNPGSLGQASPHPGVAPAAGAAIADGTEAPAVADEPTASKATAPVEKSEAAATEYAPPRAQGVVPGAAPTAAAALSDGTEDPTLSEEPAVKMMAQNEAQDAGVATGATTATKTPAAETEKDSVDSADKGAKDISTPAAATSTAAASSAPTAPETPKKKPAGTESSAGTSSAANTPAKSTTTSTASTPTGDGKKKKRHRLSAFVKKIFD